MRRVAEHVRAELPIRAQIGSGLDLTYMTRCNDGVLRPAQQLLHAEPTETCLALMVKIGSWLLEQGAPHVNGLPDIRGYGQIGAVTITWDGGPTARAAAEEHAHGWDGATPLLPAWIGLKALHDFDLRWQPPY